MILLNVLTKSFTHKYHFINKINRFSCQSVYKAFQYIELQRCLLLKPWQCRHIYEGKQLQYDEIVSLASNSVVRFNFNTRMLLFL